MTEAEIITHWLQLLTENLNTFEIRIYIHLLDKKSLHDGYGTPLTNELRGNRDFILLSVFYREFKQAGVNLVAVQ